MRWSSGCSAGRLQIRPEPQYGVDDASHGTWIHRGVAPAQIAEKGETRLAARIVQHRSEENFHASASAYRRGDVISRCSESIR